MTTSRCARDVWWLMDKCILVSCSSRLKGSSLGQLSSVLRSRSSSWFPSRTEFNNVLWKQIVGLSRGGAQDQFIIGGYCRPRDHLIIFISSLAHVIPSLATLATSVRSFASVLWESGVGLAAPFFDVIEAIFTVNCGCLAWDRCLRYPTEHSGDVAGAFLHGFGGIAGVGVGPPTVEREHYSTPQSGVVAPRGASASSRKKTERPQIGLLLFWFVVGAGLVCQLCVPKPKKKKRKNEQNKQNEKKIE